jgi:hypothetical protein
MSIKKNEAIMMGFFHVAGQTFGQATGYLLGEPIRFVGRIVGNDFIEEIGDGVQNATEMTGETIGRLTSGTVDTARGFLSNDEQLRRQGAGDLFTVMEQTAKGLEQAVVHTAENGKDIFLGLVENDHDKLTKGTKGIVKTVVIGGIAVGLVDFVNGSEGVASATETTESQPEVHHPPPVTPVLEESSLVEPNTNMSDEFVIQTVNYDIEGNLHEETGVPFSKETMELPNGDSVTGVFPDFQEVISNSIPENLYLDSDHVQFEAANSFLANKIEMDPELQKEFTTEQYNQIQLGETPDGYVWHHHEVPGRLELVDEEIHSRTGHTGGRFIWGGGTEYR